MPNILEDLPRPSQVSDMLTGQFNPSQFVGGMQNLGVDSLKQQIIGQAPPSIGGGLSAPPIPTSLTKQGFASQLSQPLDQIKSINSNSLVGNITSNPLPVNLPAPSFDLNKVIGQINSKIIPVNVATPTVDTNVPLLDFSALTEPLNRLAQAGVTTPLRLLTMTLKIVQALVNTVTNTDKMVALATESLDEIYASQAQTLNNRLPLASVENALAILNEQAKPMPLLDQYKHVLDEIEILGPNDYDQVRKILTEARTQVIPQIYAIEQIRLTLNYLQQNDATALSQALSKVLDLSAADDVFLQPYFDALEKYLGQLLDGVAGPINQLKDMAQQITQYLNQAADTAEQTARKVSDEIETRLKQVNDLLQTAQQKIQEVEAQIEEFLKKIDISAAITKVKDGCNIVGDGVEKFFTKIEELKQQLDEAVAKAQVEVDKTLTQVFATIEQKIRELLGKITEVLNRPEVKDALSKARQGIEKFETTISEASLKPVFDLVVNKTGQLEGSVKSLDVAKMGTPQKTALKVGAKVIQEVKVDEIIKPELLAAFAEIRAPLQELVQLLKDKALLVEKIIDDFNPGSLANDLILNSEPYKIFISTLESFQPSQLLAPLKEANQHLTDIVKQLDPQLIIDEVQKLYDKLAELVDAVSPAPLTKMISDVTDIADFQLKQVRDVELGKILQTIKSTISLDKLLEKSGLQDIAHADFWQILKDTLGGAYLNTLSDAVGKIQTQLAAQVSALRFPKTVALLPVVASAADKQLVADDGGLLRPRLNDLSALLVTTLVRAKQLQDRRSALQTNYHGYPEITFLLAELDLTPLIQLQIGVDAVKAMGQADQDKAVAAVNAVLRPNLPKLKALNESAVQDVIVAIFQKQVGDPVKLLVVHIQEKLKPFKEAVDAIQTILTTLTEIPARIDKAVGDVLDTLGSSIRSVITEVLAAIQTFKTALTDILNAIYARVQRIVGELSPYWILNSFTESDFAGTIDSNGAPQGMVHFAAAIISATEAITQLLQSKFSADELNLLKNDTGGSLQKGNRDNVLKAVNACVRDPNLCTGANIDAVKTKIDAQIHALSDKVKPVPSGTTPTDDERKQRVDALKLLYRLNAVRGQVMAASIRFNNSSGAAKTEAMLRLNRLLLEASYPDDIKMSLQSLHPFIVEEVSQLYPQTTVDRLDAIYKGVIDKVKKLPDQLIRAPLDDEFKKIKDILKQNFDIAGIFDVLDKKLTGLDQDLSQGLDRLGVSYNQLLRTLDQRLAA